MVRMLLCSLVLVLILGGCRKDESTDEYPWPVWILRVTVRDGDNPNQEMPNCAHVFWSIQGSDDTHDWGCHDSNGFVKVWDHISGNTQVFFRVECEGFIPSIEYTVEYDYARVDSTDPQEEVIENRTVTLYHQ